MPPKSPAPPQLAPLGRKLKQRIARGSHAIDGRLDLHGYTQAEGVANLDQVPETGALVAIGFPKLQGGLGGYARFIAICPPDWKYGVRVGEVPEAPLARQSKPLHWDTKLGVRVR